MNPLHREKGLVRYGVKLKELDKVFVADLSEMAKLGLQALYRFRMHAVECLQGDFSACSEMRRLVNDAHSTVPQHFIYSKRSDGRAHLQGFQGGFSTWAFPV